MRMLFTVLMLAAGLTGSVRSGEEYTFPKGVPVDVKSVTWYESTDHYQFFSEGTSGVHNRTYNISAAKPFERFGNANLEFPWKTGGIDSSDNGKGFKFYKLPPKGKITYYRARRGSYVWQYPEGMLFGEVLTTDNHTTEVRTMAKVNGQWVFKIYRPFSTREDVRKYIVSESLYAERLRNRHPKLVIDESALVDEIELTNEGVKSILAQPFRDVTDVVFSESQSGYKCYAPTTRKIKQIVPTNYQGGFFTSKSCVSCHQTVGMEANDIERNRDWYGSVRGSDSVLSFSIFDDSCASRNGFSYRVVLDHDLVHRGILQRRE